jgi:hypothetical protein
MPVILTAGHERVIVLQRDWLERKRTVIELDNRMAVVQRQLAEAENNAQMARIIAEVIPGSLTQQAAVVASEIKTLGEMSDRLARERTAAAEILKEVERGPTPEANFERGLITRPRLITGLLARADLTLEIATIDSKIAENATNLTALDRQLKSIAAAQGVIAGRAGLSLGYEELEKIQTWNKGRVNLAIGEAEKKLLDQNLRDLESLKSEILKSLEPISNSPLLTAARQPVVVAFVPYENLTAFHEGHSLFRCRLWLVWCVKIGVIGRLVDGEVSLPHPLYGRYIRGAFYGVSLEKGEQAAQGLLVFSSRPLFL